MVAICGVGSMLYVLPMLLGRTYDVNDDIVGIDIFDPKYIEEAKKNPFVNPVVTSMYSIIDETSEKRNFLGISGDLALKFNAGLLDINGAGSYLKDTSSIDNSIEILIKMNFQTMIEEISIDAQPLEYWKTLDRKIVGTHVVTSLTYGGEVYASVNFIAHKEKYLQKVKAEVTAAISKSGAFDLDVQGKLDMLSKNLSSKAKMEIDYYGTVPLDGVPTTIKGLSALVARFKEQAEKVNNGNGVILCAGLRELSDWESRFSFAKNSQLMEALDEFNYFFNNLREAKSLLKTLINSLPETVSDNYMRKVTDFSTRLTDTLNEFYKTIGNLNLTLGSFQLNAAEKAFEKNSKISGDNRYTKEIRRIMSEYDEKVEVPYKPRGIYTRWGKKTCGTSDLVYAGYTASFTEHGIGAGFNYQCLPEKPDLKLSGEYTGFNQRTSKLAGVRYRSMSMFENKGKRIEGKGVTCAVCTTPMRPTVNMFPARQACPGDWVEEYMGYLVATDNRKSRAEFICVDKKPDSFQPAGHDDSEPDVLPAKMGSESDIAKDASVPCVVCSK